MNGFITDVSKNFKHLLGIQQGIASLPVRFSISELNEQLMPGHLFHRTDTKSVYFETEISTRMVLGQIRLHTERKVGSDVSTGFFAKVRVLKDTTSK